MNFAIASVDELCWKPDFGNNNLNRPPTLKCCFRQRSGWTMGGENMQHNLMTKAAVLLVSLVLAATVSCAKKNVTTQDGSVSAANEDSYANAGQNKSLMEEGNMNSTASESQPESGSETGIVMQQDVYFEFDKATLAPDAREQLIHNGEWLRINSDVNIVIEGHCDERGTNEYNLALGDRRAETVRIFLTDLGINTSRLTTISYGEEQPANPSHTESAWAQNRRAHFLIR
jgi:peptidoglycan-associated lipoprotein